MNNTDGDENDNNYVKNYGHEVMVMMKLVTKIVIIILILMINKSII